MSSDYKQQWITDRFMLLSDSLDNICSGDTVLEQVQSGLIVYNVMDWRLLLATVLILAGVHTTTTVAATDPWGMCQSGASVRQLPALLWRLRYLAPAKVLNRKYICIPANSLDFNKLIAFIIDKDSEILGCMTTPHNWTQNYLAEY